MLAKITINQSTTSCEVRMNQDLSKTRNENQNFLLTQYFLYRHPKLTPLIYRVSRDDYESQTKIPAVVSKIQVPQKKMRRQKSFLDQPYQANTERDIFHY